MSPFGVRNSVGWRDRLARLRGSSVLLDLSRYDAALGEIDALGVELAQLTEPELRARARRGRDAAAAGQPLAALRSELYALARELSRHLLGMRPFDVQIVAALAMDEGAIAEMQTGEGKTLAAVMPAAFNALAGRGVHVLTFNDYLARRDAEWMAPVYQGLGLSVAFVQQGMARADRQQRLSRGCDLRDGEGGGLRLPARSPGPERLRTWCTGPSTWRWWTKRTPS